jgi:sulfotransferase family protein
MRNDLQRIRLAYAHLKTTRDFLLHRKPAGRQMTVLPDDLFIVSYPKSGNTWTRFLLGNLIYQDEPVTFRNVESRIPSIYIFSDRQLLRLPRIFKSHDCFDPRYKKIIYIVRDPRDVTVSAYHYSIKVKLLPDSCPMEEFVPLFMSGTFGSGLLADPRWGSWHDNVASWLAMQHNRKFLLLRYEDMLEDAGRELRKVADFLGIAATPERIARAVELSSADKMRAMEKSQSKDWHLTKETRQDKPFVRKARAGTWHSEMPPAAVAKIESSWGSLMQTLGYKLAAAPQTAKEPVLAR